jgi:hypothetical protein
MGHRWENGADTVRDQWHVRRRTMLIEKYYGRIDGKRREARRDI